ncbi:MAG: hypothetical protein IKF11_08225 [Methanobrevibacter sp.]|nr:hypothetical protein [Methanobrevibacter sp.]
MIINKNIALLLTICFFTLLMLVSSSLIMVFLPKGIHILIGIILIIIFFRLSKLFYAYLRNDDFYKNNKAYCSDKKGEKYFVKGKSDSKKLFVIVWVIVIFVISAITMWLYLINHALI